MDGHRIAVFGIALALTTSSLGAAAQGSAPAARSVTQAGSATDSTTAAAVAADTVPNFFRDVKANAFVSLGYTYNVNQPSDRINRLRVFESNANSFLIDVAEVVFQKPVSKLRDVGFRVDLEAGSAIPVKTQSAGLTIGTGAVATYAFNSRVAATAMVVNGWDLAVDNNEGKTLGVQLVITPVAPLLISLHYMGGPETADTNAFTRHIGDVVATYKVNDMLAVGINGDYGVEKGASVVRPGQDAKWRGIAGYVKLSPNDKFFVALRGETFKDEGGTRLGLGKNTTAHEFTVTPTYKLSNNFVVRAEGRYDSINQAGVFLDDKGNSRKNQATVGVNAIFVY